MSQPKTIVLGVTGSIAAFKAADLASRLVKLGHTVQVVMTREAREFITPLTLQTLSKRPVVSDLFDEKIGWQPGHIELADNADLLLIAPATAQIIAELSHGFANHALVRHRAGDTRAAAHRARDERQDVAAPRDVAKTSTRLRARGARFIGPKKGLLACGYEGVGRLWPVDGIVEAAQAKSSHDPAPPRSFAMKILITAGPTREPIDPVRFLSNRSSGKMGYAIAAAAVNAGHEVVLISGPVALAPPAGATTVQVVTSEEMYEASHQWVAWADVCVLCAAVADFRPARVEPQQDQKRRARVAVSWSWCRRATSCFRCMNGAAGRARPVLVGFAAETNDLLENAWRKLRAKGCALHGAQRRGPDRRGF